MGIWRAGDLTVKLTELRSRGRQNRAAARPRINEHEPSTQAAVRLQRRGRYCRVRKRECFEALWRRAFR